MHRVGEPKPPLCTPPVYIRFNADLRRRRYHRHGRMGIDGERLTGKEPCVLDEFLDSTSELRGKDGFGQLHTSIKLHLDQTVDQAEGTDTGGRVS